MDDRVILFRFHSCWHWSRLPLGSEITIYTSPNIALKLKTWVNWWCISLVIAQCPGWFSDFNFVFVSFERLFFSMNIYCLLHRRSLVEPDRVSKALWLGCLPFFRVGQGGVLEKQEAAAEEADESTYMQLVAICSKSSLRGAGPVLAGPVGCLYTLSFVDSCHSLTNVIFS